MSSEYELNMNARAMQRAALVGAVHTAFMATRDPRVLLAAASTPGQPEEVLLAVLDLASGPLVADPEIVSYVLALTCANVGRDGDTRTRLIADMGPVRRDLLLARVRENPALGDIADAAGANARGDSFKAAIFALQAVAEASVEPARAYLSEIAEPVVARTSSRDRGPVRVGFRSPAID